MGLGHESEQESIGALLGRLIEDGRTLAKAELAVFRTDFYRRIGRARTGALLCLIGAIMGQAAAVTLLVTLSFVLTPWIGRLGGAAVSVLLGFGMAVVLIRVGIRKLVLVVEDPEDDELDTPAPRGPGAIDELFDRVRRRSREARAQLIDTVGEAQARLHPQALIADLADEIVDHVQNMVTGAIETVRSKPVRSAAILSTLLLLLVRPPVLRMIGGIGRATRRGAASLKDITAGRAASTQDEEKTS